MISIVLVEPEIPQNAGNIVRTCAAIGADLYMVKPLGFEVSDKYLKRAGLDYWQFANVKIVDSFSEIVKNNPDADFWYASTKSKKTYADVKFSDNCFIVFGKETKGLDEKLLHDNYDKCIRIPMKEGIRSLNLSNSVAIVAYEAMRQNDFKNLENYGSLTKY